MVRWEEGEGGRTGRGELGVNLSSSLTFRIYVLRYIVYSCPQMWSYDHLSVNHNSTPRFPPKLYPDVRSHQSLLYHQRIPLSMGSKKTRHTSFGNRTYTSVPAGVCQAEDKERQDHPDPKIHTPSIQRHHFQGSSKVPVTRFNDQSDDGAKT